MASDATNEGESLDDNEGGLSPLYVIFIRAAVTCKLEAYLTNCRVMSSGGYHGTRPS
jgi:hypothetical protein